MLRRGESWNRCLLTSAVAQNLLCLGPLLQFPCHPELLGLLLPENCTLHSNPYLLVQGNEEALLPSWCDQGNSNTREVIICVMGQVLQSTAQVWLVPDKPGRAWGRRTGQGRSLRPYPWKRGPVWSCRPLWTETIPHRVSTRGKICAFSALPSH